MATTPFETFLTRLVQTLVVNDEITELLPQLATSIGEHLGADDVGIVVRDEQDHLRLLTATSSDARALEMFQVASNEGPCVHAFASGETTNVGDLLEAADRWPEWSAAAGRLEFGSVLAMPLSAGDVRFGALNLLGRGPMRFSDEDRRQAVVIAEAISTIMAAQRRQSTADGLAEQLQRALESRVVIEQAKGMLAQQLGVQPLEAFELLRAAARSSGTPLRSLAEDVVRLPGSDHLARLRRGSGGEPGAASALA